MKVVVVFTFAVFVIALVSGSVTVTEDGGYKKVIVALSPDIQESQNTSLLLSLENLFASASKFLHTATRNWLYFEEVIFLLPKSTNITLPDNRLVHTAVKYFTTPDILVVNNGGIFRNNPFTIQIGGCREPGLRIYLPAGFLMNKSNDLQFSQEAKVFTHEWAHYRYGIFDEHGFPEDKLYPLYYRVPGQEEIADIHLTQCTNQQATYLYRNFSGAECPSFSVDCLPVPDIKNNDDIVSSLMYLPSFPEVSQFCDENTYKHNRNAPSKHNALCKEESTWKIIKEHDDFKGKRDNQTKKKDLTPTFKYVVETEPRIVFAIEATDNMAINDKMDLLQNAFSYFVLYDLPKNSKVGLVSMKESAKSTPLYTVNINNESIFGAFPEAYGKGNTCIHCGILSALEVLKSDNIVEARGTIILVSTVDILEHWIENITSNFNEDIKLFVITFASLNTKPMFLERLAVSTGGRLFVIPEEIKDNRGILAPLTLLYETFRSIYQSFSWTFMNNVLVDQRVFDDNSTDYGMSFAIDENIDSFLLLLTGPNFLGAHVVKDKIILRDEDTEYVPGHTSFSYKARIPAFVYHIKNPMVGIWNFSFSRKPGFTAPLIVIIRAMHSYHHEYITAQSWISVPIGVKNYNEFPLVIYAEVRKGIHPIANANVTAVVHHPQFEKLTTIQLSDQGEGDPDVTKNDGIYTKYFTDFSISGYYILSIFVSSNYSAQIIGKPAKEFNTISLNPSNSVQCCGSSIPSEGSEFTVEFSRANSYGSFYIKSDSLENDIFPPRRIVDLKVIHVVSLNNHIKHFTLQWTAPGSDFDSGKADIYELKLFHTRDDALKNFETKEVLSVTEWDTHGPWLQPDIAGTIQNITIQFKNISSGSYFLALRAIDSAGNKGDISNVVEVYYTAPPPLPSTTALPTFLSSSFNPDHTSVSPTVNTHDVPNEKDIEGANIGLVVGIVCGVLLLLLAVGILLIVCLGRFRKDQEKKENLSVFVLENDKAVSSDPLYHSTTSLEKDPSEYNIISPITSWPADVLLSHYDKVQLAKENNEKPPVINLEDVSDSESLYLRKTIADQSSVIYDPINFRQTRFRDDVNFPFNPIYASSFYQPHNSESISYKLKTDV